MQVATETTVLQNIYISGGRTVMCGGPDCRKLVCILLAVNRDAFLELNISLGRKATKWGREWEGRVEGTKYSSRLPNLYEVFNVSGAGTCIVFTASVQNNALLMQLSII